MTFPPSNADSDPDPTSQIAWPGRQGERGRRGSNLSNKRIAQEGISGSRPSVSRANGRGKAKPAPTGSAVEAEASPSTGKKRMSAYDLICISISMGGSQVAWTVELG